MMDKLLMDVFFDGNDDLLEKCNTFWDKFSADIKEEFDSEPVYNKKFLNQNKISWQ